jgi:hypothetical protein
MGGKDQTALHIPNARSFLLSTSCSVLLILGVFVYCMLDGKALLENKSSGVENKLPVTRGAVTSDDTTKDATIPFNFTDIVLKQGLARSFKKGSAATNAAWCTQNESTKEEPTGLLMVKIPKAATSTVSGAAYRIARNFPKHHAHSIQNSNDPVIAAGGMNSTMPCDVGCKHIPNYKAGQKFGHRNKEKSFLLTSVRDPAKRAISRVFFGEVSQNKKEPTDENVLHGLEVTSSHLGAVSPGKGGFQLAYLALHDIREGSAWKKNEPTEVFDPEAIHKNVQSVIDDYDFIVVVERLHESLVAWQLLLGLDVTDILYLSSKKSGGYWYRDHNAHKECVALQPTFVTPRVAEYLSSDEWYAKNYGDYILSEAASQSLDLTIDELGKERFDKALKEYLAVKAHADEKCAHTAIFPCSEDGVRQPKLARTNCYKGDQGCGYPCLDELSSSR